MPSESLPGWVRGQAWVRDCKGGREGGCEGKKGGGGRLNNGGERERTNEGSGKWARKG